MKNCRTDSKKHCIACEHYDYCGDKANRCNGECHLCDDYDCENNPLYKTQTRKKKIEVSELYKLCNREKLFTCGSANQYEKMFELASAGITQFELAYTLYLCSEYRLDVVYNMITPLFKISEKGVTKK